MLYDYLTEPIVKGLIIQLEGGGEENAIVV
jgi:hypothetical protein